MQDEVFCVISFDSSHQAIAAEVLVAGMQGARLVPLPPEISEGCGLALRVNREDVQKTLELLQANGAVYQNAYEMTVSGAVRSAEKLS